VCDAGQSKVPLEERIKNAIQNSFQKHKTTLSLKNLGMGPTLPLHICRLNYVVRAPHHACRVVGRVVGRVVS
jgi:hypothetical protein